MTLIVDAGKKVIDPGKPAGADLRTKQFFFVKFSSGTIVLAGAGEEFYGILMNKPNTNEAAEVLIHGPGTVVTAGTLAQGLTCMSDANGKADTPSGDTAYRGVRLLEAGVAGKETACFVSQPWKIA